MAEYVCELTDDYPGIEFGDEDYSGACERRERVVRCRDCKNYRPAEDDEHEDGCALAYAYLFETSPDGFCAWGNPRKEG